MIVQSSKFRLFLAILSSILLWLALPGEGGLWPLLFVGLLPFLTAIYFAESRRQVAFYGFVFGLVHYLCLLYWLIFVLGTYGGLPWFVAVPALVLLAAYMASYTTAFSLFAHFFFQNSKAIIWLWFIPVIWVGNDWLRSVLFSGFPWMDLGYGLWSVPLLTQAADLFGHHFLTFCIVLVNGLFFQLCISSKTPIKPARLVTEILPVVCLLLIVIGYSQLRLQQLDRKAKVADRAQVGIVQGNINQNEKWSPAKKKSTVDSYLQLTKSIPNWKSLQMVVWPETAIPFYPNSSKLFSPISTFLVENEVNLLTGAPWYEVIDHEKKDINYFNSALLIGDESKLIGKYYKNHLVPYGEYVPLKKFLPFLAPLVQTVGDFTPGVIEEPLVVGEIKSGVLLCFESIFPDIGRKWSEKGANILVNLTNDAWYGKSSAPYHSFAMTALRAVEVRRSVVRSANTGISGVIEPSGRVLDSSEIFVSWAKGFNVFLHNEITIFVRGGYLFGPFCLIMGLGTMLVLKLRCRKNVTL